MRHIYLSSHLDDAVLSCGGTIHRLSAGGEAVQVMTLLAGNPTPGSEPLPYAEDADAVQAALGAAGAGPWRDEIVPLTATGLRAKVEAIGYYRSQMAVLFGGAQAMPNRVWAFAASRTTDGRLAERLWWPPEP